MEKKLEFFETWALLEIMGHVKIAGKIRERNVFGVVMCEIEVPAIGNVPAWSKMYGGASIYSVTPLSEEDAKRKAEMLSAKPYETWEINNYVQEIVNERIESGTLIKPQLPAGPLNDEDIDLNDEEE